MFVRRKALKIVSEFARRKLSEATIDEQIVLYQALSAVMPTRSDRSRAAEIARTLSRAAALQTDFTAQLFLNLHPHNGDGDGEKGAGN